MINIKYEIIFKEFCQTHGYNGKYAYNSIENEYEIILTKDEGNAGAALTDGEYQKLTERQLKDILVMLHMGFQAKFNK